MVKKGWPIPALAMAYSRPCRETVVQPKRGGLGASGGRTNARRRRDRLDVRSFKAWRNSNNCAVAATMQFGCVTASRHGLLAIRDCRDLCN
jgi:hypothetical protein